MKFAYATVIVLCLLASTSWSASNPLIKNCNIAGGDFTVVETVGTTADKYDQWGLCKFDQAYVGALDVMFFNTKTADAISLDQYKNDAIVCNGKILEVRILQAKDTMLICQYQDKTIIDLGTLSSGPFNPANQKLNNYLGL